MTEPVLRPLPGPDPAPILRVANRALPAYRFVPGLHPHPFRHEGGHMYTDGSAPDEPPWNPDTPWAEDDDYLWGCDLFDHRYYWEAHEAFEALWHSAEKGSVTHTFLQALIQAAASILKRHVEYHRGASSLHQRSVDRFERCMAEGGETIRGVHIPELLRRLDGFHEHGTWPTLPIATSP